MMDELRQQAERFGTDVRDGEITAVDFSKRPFTATTDDGTAIKADTVIIATGASAKYLGIDDEQRYAGRGVSACATCDGFFYRKKTVAVVGGGDTACEEASYLSNLADKVYMIVRKDYLRASKVMQRRVMENQKIEIFFNTNTVGLFGDAKVEGAHLVRLKALTVKKPSTLPSTDSSSASDTARTLTSSPTRLPLTSKATSRPTE